MEINAYHTVLAEVTSRGSGGRARVVHGHEFVVKFTDPFLTSRKFSGYGVGQRLIVKLACTRTRRLIQDVTPAQGDEETVVDFIVKYGSVLESQAARHIEIERKYWGAVPEASAETGEPKSYIRMEADTWMDAHKIFIRGEDLTALNAARKLSERRPVKLLMVGPSGYGKTSVPEALARNWGMKFLRWDCANVRDPEEFFGYREAVDGSTVFVPTEFSKTVQEGNCIIVLDELNRLEPYLSNTLFPLLDHAGETLVHGERIKVGGNVMFFATINVGYQFTGTFSLDTALLNRFDMKFVVRPLPIKVEKELLVERAGVEMQDADRIVSIMTKLRQMNASGKLDLDASTRVSIQVAEMVGVGMPMNLAFSYVVLNGVSEEESKNAIDAVSSILD